MYAVDLSEIFDPFSAPMIAFCATAHILSIPATDDGLRREGRRHQD
jgi:hypothetical protein